MSTTEPSRGPMLSAQPAEHRTLLADLESRQDELLRMLSELEERTKQALAQLSPVVPESPSSAGSLPDAALPATGENRPVPNKKAA